MLAKTIRSENCFGALSGPGQCSLWKKPCGFTQAPKSPTSSKPWRAMWGCALNIMALHTLQWAVPDSACHATVLKDEKKSAPPSGQINLIGTSIKIV